MVAQDIIDALTNMRLISLTYTKEKTGEMVNHKGGMYEIGTNKAGREVIWLWDTDRNDTIRQFLIDNIVSYDIHPEEEFIRTNPWPIKLYGEIIQV
jgi:hypothetical protein